MMKDLVLRKLDRGDFERGFLEVLENLTVVEKVNKALFDEIFDEVSLSPRVYSIFVAELDYRVAGTITLLVERKFIHAGGCVGHVEDLSVRKGCERKGVGSTLLDLAVREAKARGCYKVILDCREEFVGFYEKQGFNRRLVQMRRDL